MTKKSAASNQSSTLQRILHAVERAGNKLPHPAILFLMLTLAVIVLSWVVTTMGLQAIHPVKKEPIVAVNLLSAAGMRSILLDMVKSFTGFAPLGTVLVAMLGFSLAEKSGLLATLLRLLVLKSPRALLVPAILLAGVMSHTGGDVGYVLLIPLAAMTFHSAGMNPVAGLAICFAGVSGGFAANFLLSTADTLLAGITQEAARIIDAKVTVTPVANWYFLSASSLLIVGVGTLIANRITIPYLGEYSGTVEKKKVETLTASERRGLKAAGLSLLALVGILLAGVLPEGGFLLDPAHPDVLNSAALKGVVAIIFLFGAVPGLAYGFAAKTFKGQNDVIEAMQDAMVTMAPYLVLVFFASQFISLFNASNIGLILAVQGSEVLKVLGLGPLPLMIGFILLTVVLDLFIGSASAKWVLMAPIFVPMFMLVGISPELTQTTYRVGDSVVNIISPLMSYFPMILAFANKYDPKAKVGTVIALMLPYSVGFLIFWTAMLLIWMTLGLPLGPGAGLHYAVPGGP